MPIYEYQCEKCGEVFEVTQKISDPPLKKGLTANDIWDLVNYVQHLPYEPLSQPPEAVHLERPRN